MAYNTSVQPTTGYSHFFLMFGRKARLPIDIMYGTGQADNFSVDRFVNDVSVVLENAYQHVDLSTLDVVEKDSAALIINSYKPHRDGLFIHINYSPLFYSV